MVYWLGNGSITTSIRPWPFSQGAIYKGQGMWSNMWGLDEPYRDSQGFQGVNSPYLTTARLGGIFLRYRLSKTAMTSFRRWTTTHYGLCQHFWTIPIVCNVGRGMRSFLLWLVARDELGRVGGRCPFHDLSVGEAAALSLSRASRSNDLSKGMRRGQVSPVDKS